MADQVHSTSETKKPMLFVSHRQDDKPLADELHAWVRAHASGRVRVFQHDSPAAVTPRIGQILTAELARGVRDAGVVILLFTTPEKDWSYCMFECGLAYRDETHQTRVIVFQCAGFAPKVFESQVCVDVRNMQSLSNFTNDFLTDPDFFPGRGEPVSGFSRDDEDVRRAAEDLHARLSPFAKPGGGEWPAHPFIRLAVGMKDWSTIDEEEDEDRQLELAKGLMRNAIVKSGEEDVGGLLGSRVTLNKSLGELLDTWKRQRRERDDPLWYEGLCRQMMRGDRTPLIRWDLMRSADDNDKTWYAPAVMRVRRTVGPGPPSIEYDVYFCRFNTTRSGAVEIGVTASPSSRPPPAPISGATKESGFRAQEVYKVPDDPDRVKKGFGAKDGRDVVE